MQFLLFYLFEFSIAQQIGGTSMESTHYDRRLFQQKQCYAPHQPKELDQSNYYITTQLIFRNQHDRLVTRVSSGAIDLNNTRPLGIDQASINITVDQQIVNDLTLYIQVIECIDCPYEVITQDLSSTKSIELTLNTKFNYRIRVELNPTSSCQDTLILYEHGYYRFDVKLSSTTNSTFQCLLTRQRSPNNVYIPLIVGGVILLVLFVACLVAQRFKFRTFLINLRNRVSDRVPPQESAQSYDLQSRAPVTTNNEADTSTATAKQQSAHEMSNVLVPRSKRLLSLDAFRGFTLIAMIFVNYGGGGYVQFEHAPWHGITIADVVFPFFVWMLGTSLVFSLKNAIDKDVSKKFLLKKIAVRTLKLLLIGFILNTRFKIDFAVVRFLGVLQRFGIVYGVIATIEVLCTRPKQYSLGTEISTGTNKAKQFLRLFRDILHFPLQWLINLALVLIWLLVVYLVPFENCPAGYLGPGGLHENGKYINCTGGITGYIDRMIFTEQHLYQYPTCRVVYGCKPPFDPENLFGALPTIFLAFLGVQAGRILAVYQTDVERLVRLFSWSILTTAIGVGLTAGTLTGGPMPLNKNLWTLSFSFFTAGLAFAGFSIMYILIDMLKWWNATPFQYPGSNSILIYITHLVFATYFPVQWQVVDTHAAHLAMGLWGCVFWIIVAYIFYKKRIFVVL
ncbi:unnamed protein product [Adineta ricciae]|uniref:Heparan-alpha-glucosaminide N-acetyltransferase-like protein n=1 Tax=Adineta ricciae TaxID=249248 RepID=A0A815RR38_ADIRI|nr:unnamed protein product [Adineta ricciae]